MRAPLAVLFFVLFSLSCEQGPVGPTGPAGPQGEPGPAAAAAYRMLINQAIMTGTGEKTVRANCPTGYVITGGGYQFSLDGPIVATRPAGNGAAWEVIHYKTYSGNQPITVYALCAQGSISG